MNGMQGMPPGCDRPHVLFDHAIERLALDELHHQRELLVVLRQREELHDVRVRQPRERRGLAQEELARALAPA